MTTATQYTWKTEQRHISEIRAGDTVIHQGQPRTVTRQDIKKCPFMGFSIFGDTYRTGKNPVTVATRAPL
jgi:hypothetical protein